MDVFAERFKECRKKARLSQAAIAAVCEGRNKDEQMTRESVAAWERGKNKPSADNLIAAAKKMGASIDYICGLIDLKDSQTVNSSHHDGPVAELAAIMTTVPKDIGDPIQQIVIQVAKLAAQITDRRSGVDWSRVFGQQDLFEDVITEDQERFNTHIERKQKELRGKKKAPTK